MLLQCTRFLPALMFVSLVCGCSHRGDVESLIETSYENLKSGGSLNFIAYDESHTTEWKVRTFHVTGTVKWDKPWYELVDSIRPFGGLPEIKIVKECKAMNDGVRFSATIYKGATDRKGNVRLELPKGDNMTMQDFVKRFPKSCFVLPNGRLMGAKIDESTFKKIEKKAISDGETLAATMMKRLKGISPQIEKCLSIACAKENDASLKKHIDECIRLATMTQQASDGIREINSALDYFQDFPALKMRSPSIGRIQSVLLDAKKESERLGQLITSHLSDAEHELTTRKRKGVVFIKPRRLGENLSPSVGQNDFVKPMDVGGRGTKSIKMGVGDVKVFDVDSEASISDSKGQGARRNTRTSNKKERLMR